MSTNDDSTPTEVLSPTTSSLPTTGSAPTTVLTAPAVLGATPARPRIRFGLIVWGLIVSAFAVATLTIVAVPARRVQFTHWLTNLEPGSIVLLSIVALGVLILLLTLVAVGRKLQQPRPPSID